MSCRLHRLLKMIGLLKQQLYPGIEQLCQLLDVRPRTVFADIKELKEVLGVKVEFDRVRRGYYLEGIDWDICFWGLDAETALWLLIGCELVGAACGKESSAKLTQLFCIETRRVLKEACQCDTSAGTVAQVQLGLPETNSTMFMDLWKASALEAELELEVQAQGSSLRKIVRAQGLVLVMTGWQLITECSGSIALRSICNYRLLSAQLS
jgi:predicted DNA-binding transcriptional regulator YafY